jgi:hypothetical protein
VRAKGPDQTIDLTATHPEFLGSAIHPGYPDPPSLRQGADHRGITDRFLPGSVVNIERLLKVFNRAPAHGNSQDFCDSILGNLTPSWRI